MPFVDGDSIAADLAESDAPETGVTVAGRDFPMPAKMPLPFPLYLQREDIDAALSCLFGDDLDDLIEVAGDRLSIDWLKAVVEQVYGEGAGEAAASSPGSRKTARGGKASRPTSAATTA
ncbi:hypothetical protein [Actinomadura litoris]|uniref:hypothetical protein n=1 Tax=Actinomadura litoris TaxID=2678616 RepID=UPI001FA6AE41|nr:hypothetical protein [Actinomadura litoris]